MTRISVATETLPEKARKLLKQLRETYQLPSNTAVVRCVLRDYCEIGVSGRFSAYAAEERKQTKELHQKLMNNARRHQEAIAQKQARSELLTDLRALSADELLDLLIKLKEEPGAK